MEDKKNIDFDGIDKWSGAEKTLAEMLLQNTIAREDSMATHTIEQAKDGVRKWFIAWLITLAAWVGTKPRGCMYGSLMNTFLKTGAASTASIPEIRRTLTMGQTARLKKNRKSRGIKRKKKKK